MSPMPRRKTNALSPSPIPRKPPRQFKEQNIIHHHNPKTTPFLNAKAFPYSCSSENLCSAIYHCFGQQTPSKSTKNIKYLICSHFGIILRSAPINWTPDDQDMMRWKPRPNKKNLLQHFNYTPTPLCSLLRWKHSQLAHNQHRYENSAAPNNEWWCRLCMCWYIEQSETNFPLLLSTHSKRFSAPISGWTKADTSRLFVGGLLGRGGWQKPTQFNEKLHSPILCD